MYPSRKEPVWVEQTPERVTMVVRSTVPTPGHPFPMVHTYQVLKCEEMWASVVASRVEFHATREKAVAYLLAWC